MESTIQKANSLIENIFVVPSFHVCNSQFVGSGDTRTLKYNTIDIYHYIT